uniref:Uncharacterized protein n=1 Tax=Rhizophora mucronata TaxID=61149 RepID=A0A2P2PAS0_RHIMU
MGIWVGKLRSSPKEIFPFPLRHGIPSR